MSETETSTPPVEPLGRAAMAFGRIIMAGGLAVFVWELVVAWVWGEAFYIAVVWGFLSGLFIVVGWNSIVTERRRRQAQTALDAARENIAEMLLQLARISDYEMGKYDADAASIGEDVALREAGRADDRPVDGGTGQGAVG